MITTQANPVLRHVRQLLDADRTAALTDGQLLERFVAHADESAFEALVRRHGPLVWAVCRRVLRHEQDAEDAFQATFLTLAHKARAIGKQASVGGWLYRVGYNTALKARRSAAARQRHERAADRQPDPDPLAEVTGRELLAALDEELQRLPERCRDALLHCYLEGRTCDEAARHLGWSVATLKRRLRQGKDRLQRRLARRGLALTPAALAATAAVPAALAAATAQAARLVLAGQSAVGVLSANAVELMGWALRSLAVTRLKASAAVLLALSLIGAGAGLVARQAQAQRPDAVPAAGAANDPPKTKPAVPPRPLGDGELAVSVRVLDAAGRPLKDARVAVLKRPYLQAGYSWIDLQPRAQALAEARTDEEGRCRIVSPGVTTPSGYMPSVIAAAPGHGLGVVHLEPAAGDQGAEIRLEAEQVVRGRLVDLQGVPVAGAKVHVAASHGKKPGAASISVEPADAELPVWPRPATTDGQGRFTLRGLGRDSRLKLDVRHERFACQVLKVETDDKDQAAEVIWSLVPARTLEGHATRGDTGKPLANALVKVDAAQSGPRPKGDSTGTITGRTDSEGRFRLVPYPGDLFTLTAYAPEGEPYLLQTSQLTWPADAKAVVKQEVGITLRRGVLVRGRVTEKDSGKAVAGADVQYQRRRAGNPFPPDGAWVLSGLTRPDGSFQVVVLPGPSHLLVKGPGQDFVRLETSSGELETGKPGGTRYYPDGLAALDVQPGAAPFDLTVTLRRGVTVPCQVLTPEGKPVAKAVALCRTTVPHSHTYGGASLPVRDGRFELRGCDPERPMPVIFLDAENQLGAVSELSAKGESAKVRLAPCGSATLRLIDGKGRPFGGFKLHGSNERGPVVFLQLLVTPGATFDPAAGGLRADEVTAYNLDRPRYQALAADAEGRMTLPTLVPGATYRLTASVGAKWVVLKEFTAESGRALDLGDMTVE